MRGLQKPRTNPSADAGRRRTHNTLKVRGLRLCLLPMSTNLCRQIIRARHGPSAVAKHLRASSCISAEFFLVPRCHRSHGTERRRSMIVASHHVIACDVDRQWQCLNGRVTGTNGLSVSCRKLVACRGIFQVSYADRAGALHRPWVTRFTGRRTGLHMPKHSHRPHQGNSATDIDHGECAADSAPRQFTQCSRRGVLRPR